MAYRMRIRKGAGKHIRALRAGRRVRDRLKAMGRADRYYAFDKDFGTISTTKGENELQVFMGLSNPTANEVHQIDRMRINYRFAQTISTTNYVPDGIMAIWAALFKATDNTAIDAIAKCYAIVKEKAQYLMPCAPSAKNDRRNVRLLKYKEFAFPYLAKKGSDTRPDGVLAFHVNIKPFTLRPGVFFAHGWSCGGFAGQDIGFQALTRVQATSGDVAGADQAPTLLTGNGWDSLISISEGDDTWKPIT